MSNSPANIRERVVVFRYLAVSTWLRLILLGTIALYWVQPSTVTVWAVTITAAIFVLLRLPYAWWGFELRKRIREGGVVVSGSAYSFANPMTYRWNERA